MFKSLFTLTLFVISLTAQAIGANSVVFPYKEKGMTVQTSDSIAEFIGNGLTTSFPIGFKFNSDSDLVVLLINTDGTFSVQGLNSDYTVSGASDEVGGSVNFYSAPSGSKKIKVLRVVDILQIADFRNQGKFYAETHEDAFDLLTMIAQQQEAAIRSTIRVSESDGEPARLPAASGRANRVMGFDENGNPVATLPASGSGAELALDLASSTNGAKGAGQVGFGSGVAYPEGSVGRALQSQNQVDEQLLEGQGANAAKIKISDSSIRAFLPKAVKNQRPYYWGGYGVNILGDSISHGAFSIDIFRNNWTNILKRCLNAEFGEENYGFTNIVSSLGSGATLSKEIHSVVRGAGFDIVSGESASWSISGNAATSTTAGATITVTVPTFLKTFGVWYRRVAGGGAFEIYVNDVYLRDISTDSGGGAAGGYFLYENMELKDNGYGVSVIKFVAKTAAPVSIIGMQYEDQQNGFQVNNFSYSGRRLAYTDRDVITRAVDGSTVFILALGHNDAASETDSAYLAAFKQRIDWIIEDSNSYGTPVLVADFVWSKAAGTPVRQELKRLAESVKHGVYLPFPDFMQNSGAPMGGTALVNTAKLFIDSSHPNAEGHKIIGETIAKAMLLSCNSKADALMHHDFWNVIPLPAAGPIKNSASTPGTSAAVRRSGDTLIFRGSLMNSAGATALAGGVYPVLSGALPGVTFGASTTVPFMVNSSGSAIESYLRTKAANAGIDLVVRSGNSNIYHEGEVVLAARPFGKGDI